METKELKQKIQALIDKAVSNNEQQKKTLNFLFRKVEETKELENIERLRKFQGGNEYLKAYLRYKSIARANYQMEHLNLTNYEAEDQENSGSDRLLEAIRADIEKFEKDEIELGTLNQPTNEQFLIMLSERIATGEIQVCRENHSNHTILYIDDGKEWSEETIRLGLYGDFKIEPDPDNKFQAITKGGKPWK